MARPANQPDDAVDFRNYLMSAGANIALTMVPTTVAAQLGMATQIQLIMIKVGADAWRIGGQTFSLAQIRTAADAAVA